jgi:uncharacterized protein (TIGR04168 family)
MRGLMTPPAATLTVVGDVHRWWRPSDGAFLERSRPDLALFVGDLGDEDVEMVAAIVGLAVPKAVLLGNHDAWQSFSRRRPTRRLRESLAMLGDDHLAYGVREVPRAGVSIVGARPFSWGGQSLRSPELYHELYGLHTHRQSAARIVEAARRAQHRDIVILAHNGPLGLSQEPGDIWGKDFGKPGGDWGDRDLALALDRIPELGLRVQMVVAGHMHDELVHPRGGRRTRFCRHGGTLFVNAAVVPRVREAADGGAESYFVRTHWADGSCLSVEEVWADAQGRELRAAPARFVELQPARARLLGDAETLDGDGQP